MKFHSDRGDVQVCPECWLITVNLLSQVNCDTFWVVNVNTKLRIYRLSQKSAIVTTLLEENYTSCLKR